MTVEIAVKRSSSLAVKQAFQLLRIKQFPSGRWLSEKNKYAQDTINRIKIEVDNRKLPKSAQLSQYIAASVILHCFDGWSFLAQAVESLLSGDTGTSVHLAYYAELRAAMSFLANDGIGIFNNHHFYLDTNGICQKFGGGGTHAMVWKAINEWSSYPAKSTQLLDLFVVNGKTLNDWLQAAGYFHSGAVAKLAKDWLDAWSLDLRILQDDHELRNEASYRPQRIRASAQRQSLVENLYRIVNFWQVCEPSVSERFSLLDKYLLRHALEETYKIRTGKLAQGKSYELFINSTLSNLGVPSDGVLKDFLLKRYATKNHVLLIEAEKKGRDPRGFLRPVSVIARALLLLRLSSAAINDLIRKHNIFSYEMKFWWKNVGEEFGLWEDGQEPDDMIDLWADVQLSIDNINHWLQLSGHSENVFQARTELAYDLSQLKQFQRVGLWAIGI